MSFYKIPFILQEVEEDLKMHLQDIELYPGIKQKLEILKYKKFQIGILSRNELKIIKAVLKKEHIFDYFRFLYQASKFFSKKRALHKLTTKHGFDKKNLIYIGDEVRDIKACKKFEIPIVAVTWGFHSKKFFEKSQPNYIVEQPKKLSNIIINHFAKHNHY